MALQVAEKPIQTPCPASGLAQTKLHVLNKTPLMPSWSKTSERSALALSFKIFNGADSGCQQLGQSRDIGRFFKPERELERCFDLSCTQRSCRIACHAAKGGDDFFCRYRIVWIALRIDDFFAEHPAVAHDDLDDLRLYIHRPLVKFRRQDSSYPPGEIEDLFAAQFRVGEFFQRQSAVHQSGRDRVRNAELRVDYAFGPPLLFFLLLAPAAHRAHVALTDLNSDFPDFARFDRMLAHQAQTGGDRAMGVAAGGKGLRPHQDDFKAA